MRKIIYILVIILQGHYLLAQTDTIKDVLFDLAKANPNNYYQYELDSGNYCLIKYSSKQKIKDVVFMNHYGVNDIDTLWNKKHNMRYYSIDDSGNKNGGEVFVIRKSNNIWISGTFNNQENGKTYFYSGKDKKLVSIYNMRNGEKYGLSQEFGGTGNIKIAYFYNKNLPPGFEWRKIYYSGTKQLAQLSTCNEKYCVNEVYYENGVLNFIDTTNYYGERVGYYKKYYDNAKLEKEGLYKEGLKEGYWKYFYKTGQLNSEGNFRKGKETGIVKYYYENGKLKAEKEFLNGMYNGKYKHYNKDGKLILIEEYEKDKRKSKKKIM